MKKTLLSALVAAAFAAALPAAAQNLAIVNGQPIPSSRATVLTEQLVQSGQAQRFTPDQIKGELVTREIYAQEAKKRGLDATQSFKDQLDLARQTVLVRALFTDFEKNNPVTEDEARAAYDKFVAANTGKEYKAHHILVQTEDQAKAIIAQLKKGASFEDIAKKKSKDPGSAPKGGALDWAAPGSYVQEFSEALTKLTKGQVTATPVKTQFGWHVIRLDDVRDAQLPKFEDIEPQIKQQLAMKKLEDFLKELRDKAKVE